MKKQVKIRTRGVSTHAPKVVEFLAVSDIDVILTTINRKGPKIFGERKEQKR